MVMDLAERLSLKFFNLVRREPALAVGDATPFSRMRPSLDSMEFFHSEAVSIFQESFADTILKAGAKSAMSVTSQGFFMIIGVGVGQLLAFGHFHACGKEGDLAVVGNRLAG